MDAHAVYLGAARALTARDLGLRAGAGVLGALTALGDHAGGGDGRAGRRVLLAVVVHLDNLNIGEELARHLGELHHEDGARGEVRGKEELAALLRVALREGRHVLAGNARGAHNHVHAVRKGALHVCEHRAGHGEVHHHVGLRGLDKRGEVVGAGELAVSARHGLPGAMGVEAAHNGHVLGGGDSVDDAGAHTALGAGNDDFDHGRAPYCLFGGIDVSCNGV